MMNIGKFLLDLIYPAGFSCFSCGKSLLFPEIKGLCSGCLGEFDFIESHCRICGRELDTAADNICYYCSRGGRNEFDIARSAARYRGIFKNLILRLKYGGVTELALPLGEILGHYLRYYYREREIDFVAAVPLHRERREIRGYNQVDLLIENMGLEIPVLKSFLMRRENSPPLYNFNKREREKILRGVFKIEQNRDISGKTVLLVDDIMTTGATVNEISSLLKEKKGVAGVYVLTLAS